MKIVEKTYPAAHGAIHYLEIENALPPLVLIHAQGVCATSYDNVMAELARKYHVCTVDCYGHGGSAHDPALYNVASIGDGIAEFIQNVLGGRASLVGHSSGGLIAAYIASRHDVCERLYLEDPPLFSSQGERRYKTFNYVDLSTLCHSFLSQSEETDFPLYYFIRQRAWDFFPPEAREKIYDKLVVLAIKNREKHPKGDLKVPFWPKAALAAFRGMNEYDPRFGEAFYTDSFHAGIPHEELLAAITCPTVIMKATTNVDEDGILQAAMAEEDAERARELIKGSNIVRFDCGHGVHMEKKKEFLKCLMD